jgi:hypothetical protein
MGNQFLNLQRLAFGRVAHQLDSLLRAVVDAHPAAHAGRNIDAGESVVHRNRRELAEVAAMMDAQQLTIRRSVNPIPAGADKDQRYRLAKF